MDPLEQEQPFYDVIKTIRQTIDSTQLISCIGALTKLVNQKIKKKENIETLHISKEFARVQVILSHLNCLAIEKQTLKILPFPAKSICFCHLEGEKDFKDLENATMIAIFIPKGLEFSLHNHPSMLVFTKPLFGKLQIDSMDIHTEQNSNLSLLQEPNFKKTHQTQYKNGSQKNHQQQNPKPRAPLPVCALPKETSVDLSTGQVHLDYSHEQQKGTHHTFNWQRKILTNSDLSMATPQRGNIHSLLAVTDCIFLDILVPDYDSDSPPTYYEYCGKHRSGGGPLIREISESKEEQLLVSLDRN